MGIEGTIAALIFAASKPLGIEELSEFLDDVSTEEVANALENLQQYYNGEDRGFHLVCGDDKTYRFQTVASVWPALERMYSKRPRPLSRAAQETLGIVAYRQPVTRADVEFIRGVDAGSILKNLLERGLIQVTGRKEDAGRPLLFATTDVFLELYGLKSLSDLPPLQAFQPKTDTVKTALNKLDLEPAVSEEESKFVF